MLKRGYWVVTVALLAGCGGVKTKTTLAPDAPEVRGRTGSVCLLAGALPPEVQFVEIARITATKRTYGSTEQVTAAIVAEAKRLGADAVVNLQADIRFKSPLPWRITSPTGDGTAVKYTSEAPKCDAIGGRKA